MYTASHLMTSVMGAFLYEEWEEHSCTYKVYGGDYL